MIMGVSRALKEAGCKARIVALEPATSPVLTTGKGGPHRVEGIAAGFRPPHLKDGAYDEVRTLTKARLARWRDGWQKRKEYSRVRHPASMSRRRCNWRKS